MSISFGGWSASGSVPSKYILHIGWCITSELFLCETTFLFFSSYFFFLSLFPQLSLDFLTTSQVRLYDSSDGIKTREWVSGANLPFDGRPLQWLAPCFYLWRGAGIGNSTWWWFKCISFLTTFFTWDSILFYSTFFFFLWRVRGIWFGRGSPVNRDMKCAYIMNFDSGILRPCPLSFVSKSSFVCCPFDWQIPIPVFFSSTRTR